MPNPIQPEHKNMYSTMNGHREKPKESSSVKTNDEFKLKGKSARLKNKSLTQTIKNYLATKYFQFEVTTALYMLESWEKALLLTLILFGIGLVIYQIFYGYWNIFQFF